MELDELTRKNAQEAVELYYGYWLAHIACLEDDLRVHYFSRVLTDLIHRLHGLEAALELSLFFLKEQGKEVAGTGAFSG